MAIDLTYQMENWWKIKSCRQTDIAYNE